MYKYQNISLSMYLDITLMSLATSKDNKSFATMSILIAHKFYTHLQHSVMNSKIFPELNTSVFMLHKHRNYSGISGKPDRKSRCQQFAV